MDKNLKITKSILINSKIEKVWDALVNPEKIKVYLFGTETTTNWNVGSTIVFQGEWEGKSYKDQGIIISFELNKLLEYSYWSSFSGLEDKPENYSIVSFQLEKNKDQILLTLIQSGFSNEQAQKHSEINWEMVLGKIKELVEKE